MLDLGNVEGLVTGDGRVVFATPDSVPVGLAPGDVLVAGVGPATPLGLLRRVRSLTPQSGRVVVETEEASLTDALEEAQIDLQVRLTAAQLSGALHAVGSGDLGVWSQAAAQGDGLSVELHDLVLYDNDGDVITSHDQIRANGSITLDPSFTYRLRITSFTLQEMSVIATLDSSVNLRAEATLPLGKHTPGETH